MKTKKFLLVAGGTGGHVFPALALAEHLQKQGHKIDLITDKRGIKFLNEESLTFFHNTHIIDLPHFRRHFFYRLKAFFLLLKEGLLTPKKIHTYKPDIVVGFGNLLSFWPVFWARVFSKPTAIYQSDAIMGKANLLLSYLVPHILCAFENTKNLKKTSHWVGFLTRPSFQPSPYHKRNQEDPFHILVLGGSQGAEILSTLLTKTIHLLEENAQKKIVIVQQCRPELLEKTQSSYAQTNASVTLKPFITNIHQELDKAHLVISRAGASTIGELALVGRPAFFIPYPHAALDHQYHNAEQVSLLQGGWMERQENLTPSRLAHFLTEAMANPKLLEAKAENIKKLTKPNAALLAEHFLLSLIKNKFFANKHAPLS